MNNELSTVFNDGLQGRPSLKTTGAHTELISIGPELMQILPAILSKRELRPASN